MAHHALRVFPREVSPFNNTIYGGENDLFRKKERKLCMDMSFGGEKVKSLKGESNLL
jgi:hypothetical protein